MRKLLLVLALVGCGDDGSHRAIIDGTVADTPMVPGDELGPQVTVTAKGTDGAPLVGAKVYFTGPDSTTNLASKTTDATGFAGQAMPQGGYVTLVVLNTTPQLIITWGDVKPTDALVYGSGAPPTTATVTFTLPPGGGTTSYRIETPCSAAVPVTGSAAGGPFPATVTFANCGATTDLMVEALSQNNAVIGSFFVPNQAITDGTTVDLTANTYGPSSRRVFNFTNNPSAVAISVTDGYTTTAGRVFSSSFPTTATDPANVVIQVPPLPTGGRDLVTASQPSGLSTRELEVWSATAGAFAIDWGANVTPDFTVAPAFDVSGHAINWTLGTATVSPDFGATLTDFQRANAVWRWEVIGSRSAQSIYPVLPDDGATYNGLMSDTISPRIAAIYHLVGGYDAVRPTFYVGGVAPSGASGVIALTGWVPRRGLHE